MTKEEIEALLNKNVNTLNDYFNGYKACAKDILLNFKIEPKVEVIEPAVNAD